MTDETPATRLVEAYLARLRVAVADLPEGTGAELLENIGAHLAETAPPGTDEAGVRRALDELGSPEEIAAAARAETGLPTPPQAPSSGGGSVYDALTVVVLFAGGFAVPVVGWLAGVVLLWAGPRWRTVEKIVGTLAWPVAVVLGVLAWVLGVHTPYGVEAGLVLVVVVVAVPLVVVFVQLLRRARARA